MGGAPSGVQGQNPWSAGQGALPPKAETLFASERSMEAANSPNSCRKNGKKRTFSYEVACKKIFMVGPKWGRASHRAPSLKYATGQGQLC